MSNDDPPTTVLVLLGNMHFEHAGTAEVLSVKISTKEELSGSLETAAERVKPSTLDALHVILKSSSVSSLYDDTAVSTFVDGLKPGGEVTVHVMGSQDMPVQAGDVDGIRMSLVMANLRLVQEGITDGEEGGWVLMAQKPGSEDEEDE
mmetsp:Transcript_3740/g.10041  ORF Transcript_3740/g.10041 Transcript_3740/m.10041 type:complete len:148 (-) Transcript_3740:939-1382(-)|eukprot:CAMPEP_0113541812 /NCGR_PEP_ID=MMETSP0015_2-20120614/9251_1 /TAXON_ID=2838 /ORGANISM="Odontella" /LENGTH=147 /DNA_ID=CAMNT_0000441783 /DNA_START=83 /DNA_END=526 /DNA_ORIENTATION=- /assembly_acc=CAM_ASM_000160